MAQKSKRQLRRERIQGQQSRQVWITRLAAGALVVFLIFAVGSIIGVLRSAGREAVGEEVEIMESINHVDDGTDVEYSTNPPTSGEHYNVPMPAGFYNEGDVGVAFPESHIVHSLEHGYVVFWYNCEALTDAECQQMKTAIMAIMEEYGNTELIAFPWPGMDEPLVMTSWGQMLRFDSHDFDVDAASNFVEVNRNHPRSPEPNAT
jgi:hypothetical protein